MKVFYYIIFCMCFSFQSDVILWDANIKLDWEDYQGLPPKNKGVKVAVSSVKINVKREQYYEGNVPHYIVKSFFNKKKSWTITNSEKSLLHERLHFDITEIYSRKIRCELKILEESEEKDVNVYKTTYRKLLKEHWETQKKYDEEVYFSKAKQKEWIDKVAKELEELKEYEYVGKG